MFWEKSVRAPLRPIAQQTAAEDRTALGPSADGAGRAIRNESAVALDTQHRARGPSSVALKMAPPLVSALLWSKTRRDDLHGPGVPDGAAFALFGSRAAGGDIRLKRAARGGQCSARVENGAAAPGLIGDQPRVVLDVAGLFPGGKSRRHPVGRRFA